MGDTLFPIGFVFVLIGILALIFRSKAKKNKKPDKNGPKPVNQRGLNRRYF